MNPLYQVKIKLKIIAIQYFAIFCSIKKKMNECYCLVSMYIYSYNFHSRRDKKSYLTIHAEPTKRKEKEIQKDTKPGMKRNWRFFFTSFRFTFSFQPSLTDEFHTQTKSLKYEYCYYKYTVYHLMLVNHQNTSLRIYV